MSETDTIVAGYCPAWCSGGHERDTEIWHRSEKREWTQEFRVLGERKSISVFAEQYLDEDGDLQRVSIVIEGDASEMESLVELSPSDAVRVAEAITEIVGEIEQGPVR